MPALETIQHQFCQSVLNKTDDITSFTSSDNPEERFLIYRSTIRENLRYALKVTFPGIWSLLGEECANNVAYLFIGQAQNFPQTGCLDDWGENFSSFLATIDSLEHLVYLKDFAYYEWLKHLSYRAKDVTSLSAQEMKHIIETPEATRFGFHPSVFFFHSLYPIHCIQDLIKDPNKPEVRLDREGCYAVITRLDDQVTTHWLDERDWQFLYDLSQGCRLEQAYKNVMTRYPDFNLVKNLQFMFCNGLIHEVTQ